MPDGIPLFAVINNSKISWYISSVCLGCGQVTLTARAGDAMMNKTFWELFLIVWLLLS